MNAINEVRRLIARELDTELAPAARTALVNLFWEVVELEHRARAERARHPRLRVIRGGRAA